MHDPSHRYVAYTTYGPTPTGHRNTLTVWDCTAARDVARTRFFSEARIGSFADEVKEQIAGLGFTAVSDPRAGAPSGDIAFDVTPTAAASNSDRLTASTVVVDTAIGPRIDLYVHGGGATKVFRTELAPPADVTDRFVDDIRTRLGEVGYLTVGEHQLIDHIGNIAFGVTPTADTEPEWPDPIPLHVTLIDVANGAVWTAAGPDYPRLHKRISTMNATRERLGLSTVAPVASAAEFLAAFAAATPTAVDGSFTAATAAFADPGHDLFLVRLDDRKSLEAAFAAELPGVDITLHSGVQGPVVVPHLTTQHATLEALIRSARMTVPPWQMPPIVMTVDETVGSDSVLAADFPDGEEWPAADGELEFVWVDRDGDFSFGTADDLAHAVFDVASEGFSPVRRVYLPVPGKLAKVRFTSSTTWSGVGQVYEAAHVTVTLPDGRELKGRWTLADQARFEAEEHAASHARNGSTCLLQH
jgi:hypothetical protein